MNKEELIRQRDEYESFITKYSKRKYPFFISFISLLVLSILLFIINVSIHSSYFGKNEQMPTSYNIVNYIVITLIIITIALFGFYLFYNIKEKNYQKKRDKVSYTLMGMAINKEI